MNIKDFVKETIIELVKATEEAEEITGRLISLHRRSDSDTRTIEFDIAVTVDSENNSTEKMSGDLGSRIKVLEAGIKGEASSTSIKKESQISRIRLGVNIGGSKSTPPVAFIG